MKHFLIAALLVFASPLFGDFSPGGPGAAANFSNGLDATSITLNGSDPLSGYESGTFDAPCGACTAPPYTFTYTRIGEQVCLTFPAGNIVLTGTSFPIFSNLPVSIRSTGDFRTLMVPLQVNGTNKISYAAVYSSDRIDLYEEYAPTADTVFPSGATLTVGNGSSESYTTCYIR